MIKIRNSKFEIRNTRQGGQVIIILLLLMLVGLSIGLAYTQRSITDVTESTQVEQSSRAFSAAEAGIQKALSSPLPSDTLILENNSSATITSSGLLPYSNTNAGIEYPPIGRETTAQFWFVDPLLNGLPVAYYNNASFDIYYGNPQTLDRPAIEVSVVMLSNDSFYAETLYYESDSSRAAGNSFDVSSCTNQAMSSGILGDNHQFLCKQPVGPIKDPNAPAADCNGSGNCMLVLARVRFLYINENHILALAPAGISKLPPQIQIYNAVGTSGQSQKQVQAFRVKSVVPPWFDFALFSTNEIRK